MNFYGYGLFQKLRILNPFEGRISILVLESLFLDEDRLILVISDEVSLVRQSLAKCETLKSMDNGLLTKNALGKVRLV